MFGTEFDVRGDKNSTLVFFYLVLPFGFSGPPGIFGRIMDAVQEYHRSFAPSHPLWNDCALFLAHVFVDDGMFLEASVGHRQHQTVEVWGRAAVLFYGEGAVSEKKLLAEGTWEERLILLGFEVDLRGDLIRLPEPKVLGAINLVNSQEFNPGCRALSLRGLQELRGSVNHWSNTGYIWRFSTEPINQMMNQADSSGIWIKCSDWGKWAAFWNVVQFIRDLTTDFLHWATLFTGAFSSLVGVEKESTVPSPLRTCIWFSGDATLRRIGGVNWDRRGVFCRRTVRVYLPFSPFYARNRPHQRNRISHRNYVYGGMEPE